MSSKRVLPEACQQQLLTQMIRRLQFLTGLSIFLHSPTQNRDLIYAIFLSDKIIVPVECCLSLFD